MAGRKPKPLHLKLIEGNPGKRKLPTNAPEPPHSEIPEPPPHLDDLAREEWNRVAPGLHAMKLLAGVDRAALAAYCVAYGRWALAEASIKASARPGAPARGLMMQTKNGNWIQSPMVGTANKAAADMVRYAAEFGMTPSARARLSVEGADKGGKFGDLIGGTKAG